MKRIIYGCIVQPRSSKETKLMCAIFGTFKVGQASRVTALGLHSMQHRAIDFAGIASSDGDALHRHRGPGLARQVFIESVLDSLPGSSAIGQLRYPTVVDNPGLDNMQPILGEWHSTQIAIVHNGNLTNTSQLRRQIPERFITTSLDTEFALRLIEKQAQSGETDIEKALMNVLPQLEGSYCFVLLLPDRLIAVRDPSGNRPLSLGKLNGGYCVASETCALTTVGAEFLDDIAPGTFMVFANGCENKVVRFADTNLHMCRFEGNYFAHPSSKVFGEGIDEFRKKLGRLLEDRHPVPGGVDIVTPVPDSANFIAMGYGESGHSGTFHPVIIRSHYAGRSFIAATQLQRSSEVTNKFNFTDYSIRGKRIVVVDDSIVRGTTMPHIVNELRRLGAKAVHVRIGYAEFKYSCKYGINTPTTHELISNHLSPEDMRRKFGADSLELLSLSELKELAPASTDSYCYACMSGQYW